MIGHEHPFSSSRRRTILMLSAWGIIIYSIIVLLTSNLMPYLGIEVFPRVVRGVDPDAFAYLDSRKSDTANHPVPRVGDTVVSVAGTTIDSLPRYVNTIANLRNQDRFPALEVDKIRDLAGCESPVAEIHGTRYVRVRFAPSPDQESDGPEYDCWFEVQDLPWQRSAISIVWFAMESLIFWMGWMVFRRRPGDDSAALFFLMCIVTVGAYMGGYHWLRILGNPGLTFIFALCATAVPQVSLHFYLLFPTPKRFVRRHPRWTLLGLYLVPGVLQIWMLWTIGSVVSAFRHGLSTDLIEHHLSNLFWLVLTYVTLGGLMFIGCIACLIHSYRIARQPIHRIQVRWILVGALLASVFVAYSFWLAYPTRLDLGGATWSMFGASLVFAVAYSISILRYRLMHAEEFLQRGVFYLLISFAGGLCYYGLLLLLAVWFAPRLSAQTPQGQAILVATFVILVLLVLSTIRTRVQKVLDRRFYREKHRLERAMKRFDEAVGKIIDRDTVSGRTLLVVGDVLSAEEVAIYLRNPEKGFVLSNQLGKKNLPKKFRSEEQLVQALESGRMLQTVPGPVLPGDTITPLLRSIGVEIAKPLVFENQLSGFLLVGPSQEGMYSSEELEFLIGITEMTSVALRSAEIQQTLEKLNGELHDKVAKISKQRSQLVALHSAVDDLSDSPARPSSLHRFEPIIGTGPAVTEMIETVRKAAASPATILIRGESGTGKTLLAEVIHQNSPRFEGPFVKVHCASLSPSLLESELFGHVKGAFTGAHRDKVGRFQIADGGTLFLDEIGDIGLDLQTKLLRVLQERAFEPVGSNDSVSVDVRIIAATHRPLEELVRQGKLREDLFYRLNVISIHTPPLRQRREDILDLSRHFLQKFAKKSNKHVEGIDEEVLEMIMTYDWPGNIRELENMMERTVVLTDSSVITASDLPPELRTMEPNSTFELAIRTPTAAQPTNGLRLEGSPGRLSSELDQIERQRLIDALEDSQGNKTQAARTLGIPRSTFCSKLKKYRLS